MKISRNYLKIFAVILALAIPISVAAITVVYPGQGGTGISSATSSQVGYVVSVSSTSPFSYNLVPNGGTPFTTTTIAGLNSTNFSLFATTTPEISTSTTGNIYLGFQPASGIVIDGINYPKSGAGIKSAITACKALPNCNTIKLTSGTYTVTGSAIAFGRSNMRLIGEGATTTTVNIDSGFTGGLIIDETLTGISNIEIAGINFDTSAKATKGFIRTDQAQNISIHDNQFTGANTGTGIWGLKIGKIGITNSDADSSYNVRIYNNYFHDNNFGTFEGIIAIQLRHSWIDGNYFYNNTNSNAYALLCYAYCSDTEIAGNAFRGEQENSIAIQQSDLMDVHDNLIDHSGDFRGIVVINSVHSKVANNILNSSSTTSLSSPAVMLFDRDAGPDGNPNRNATSTDISVSNNTINGFFYGVSMQNSGAGYKLWIQGLNIDHNNFSNVSTPIILGTSAPDGISNVFIRANNIYSWSAVTSGAIQLRGATADITKFKNIYIEDNWITPSTGGASSSGIRLIGVTAERIKGNYLVGTGQTFADISFANNAIANEIYGNTHNTGDLFIGKTSTGTTVFAVDNTGSTTISGQLTLKSLGTTGCLSVGAGGIVATTSCAGVGLTAGNNLSDVASTSASINNLTSPTGTLIQIGNPINGSTTPDKSLTLSASSTGISFSRLADDLTNFERMIFAWSGTQFRFQTTAGGTGTARSIAIDQGTTGGAISFNGASPWIDIGTQASKTTAGTLFVSIGDNTIGGASGNLTDVAIQPLINQSSTGGYTASLVQPNVSSTGSGTQRLLEVDTLQSSSTPTLAINANGTSASAGFVGIATGTPSDNLQVNGSFRLSSASSSIITASIGGAIVSGGCDSATSTIDSSISSSTTAFTTTPQNDPGSTLGRTWAYSFISSVGVLTTRVCSNVTVTPNSTPYVVKIFR